LGRRDVGWRWSAMRQQGASLAPSKGGGQARHCLRAGAGLLKPVTMQLRFAPNGTGSAPLACRNPAPTFQHVHRPSHRGQIQIAINRSIQVREAEKLPRAPWTTTTPLEHLSLRPLRPSNRRAGLQPLRAFPPRGNQQRAANGTASWSPPHTGLPCPWISFFCHCQGSD
jgi:hypothetical protein